MLLDMSQQKSTALACKTSIGSGDESGSRLDVLGSAVRKSLQTRTQLETDDQEALKVMTTLLAELLKPSSVLTTESPLNASSLGLKLGNYPINADLNNKRKRDEMPDGFDGQPIFGLPTNGYLEELADSWPNHVLELIKPTVCHRESQSKSIPEEHMNQKRQRKRLKRVTETGSPLPMVENPHKPNSKLARMRSPDLSRQEVLPNTLDKGKLQDLVEKLQQVTSVVETPKHHGSNPQSLKSSDRPTNQKTQQFDGSKPANGRYGIQDFQTQEAQPQISTPAHNFSLHESMTAQGDELVFDQYLDFDGGVTVLSKYPENIFSSPERPVLVGGTNSNENPIVNSDVQQLILPQAKVLPSLSENDIHEAVTSPIPVADTKPRDFQDPSVPSMCSITPTKHEDVPRLTSSLDGHSDKHSATLTDTNVTNRYQPSPTTYPATETVCTPVALRASKESELVESKITPINGERDQRDSNSGTCCSATLENVSLLQVRQLVASEVEKAVKGIGAYLCSVTYRDLAPAQCYSQEMEAISSTEPSNITHRDRISRNLGSRISVSGKLQERDEVSKASQLPSSLQRQSPDLSARVDPDETFQGHVAELDVFVDSTGIAHEAGISSSTINSNLSSPSLAVAPSDISHHIVKQVQDLKPEFKPVFLQAMTLLVNAFRPLNDTQQLLNRAAENFNMTLGKPTINQMNTALDQTYQRKSETLLSQLGTSINGLEKLQTSCEHQNDLPLRQFESHSKPISLIDLALNSLKGQTVY